MTTIAYGTDSNRRHIRGIKAFLLGGCAALLVALSTAAVAAMDGHASLSKEQRKAYLYYYAPIIMKRSGETAARGGFDWITNYDFDRDGVFGNNAVAWENVGIYSTDASDLNVRGWKIRPTLYSALIEFREGTDKSLILLYHVYHALEQGSIHDWERVELRIDKVSGTPGGAGELVTYLVLTEHSDHVLKLNPPVQDFMKTANGYHPILWQAKWQDTSKPDKNQLQQVSSGWSAINTAKACATCPATVNVTHYNKQPFHYVFVPQQDSEAVAYWNAVTLANGNAPSQAAKTSATQNWGDVKRLTYELQDLADILPTHAVTQPCTNKPAVTENGYKTYEAHWDIRKDDVDIRMDDALKSESGVELIPASASCNQNIRFIRYSLNDPDNAQGYPYKHWFWGAYVMNKEGDTDKAFNGNAVVKQSKGNTQKRECSAGYRKYWCQHDYYAHTGSTQTATHGRWLGGNWHTTGEGGFDGRWVQLFDDNH